MRGTLGIVIAGIVLGGRWGEAQQPTRRDSAAADSAVVLAPLQVSVVRAPTALRNVPFAVSVVGAADLRRGRTTQGLDETLVEIPGVLVSNRYNQSLDQRVSIRGFGARSAFGVRGVKVLLDGIPQTLPDGQGQLTNIDLAAVSSIEVLRGSASSLFGNASGGVIDVRTADPDITRPDGFGRVTTGAYGLVKWGGGVSLPAGRGTVGVTGSQTTLDGFREHSESDQRQFGLRVAQQVTPATALRLSAHVADAPVLDNPGSLNLSELAQDPAMANPRNVDADAGKSVTQGQVGVSVEHVMGNGGTFDAAAFGLLRDLENPLSFAYISLDRQALGARAVLSLPLGSGALTVGADLQRQRDDRLNWTPDRSEITLDQLERVTELGPFARLSLDAGDRVTFTAGGRYDRIAFSADDRLLADGDDSGDRVMSSVSGSFGGVVHAADALQPYANVSSSFESPTTTELVNRPTGAGGFNPELSPQTAVTVEGGVRGTVAGVLSYSVAAFRATVDDALIPFEVATDPGRTFFRNAGSAIHRGIEAEASVRPVRALAARFAYTYSNHTFDAFATDDAVLDGNRIPGIPGHELYASVRVDVPGGFWLASDNTYRSSLFADDANTAEIDGYWNVALRGGWDRAVGGWRVAPFAGVSNLLDERYVGSVVVNASFGRYYEPSPPRNGYVGVEIRPAR